MTIRAKSHNSGFSLVELLTVMAIFAVLAAISFAVFARVREKGRNATCQSNLKQMALAMQQYRQDSDGRFPAYLYILNRNTSKAKGMYWHDVIMPYVKDSRIFLCPSSSLRERTFDTHYVYNLHQLNDMAWGSNRTPRLNEFAGSPESKHLLASSVYLNSDMSAKYGDGFLASGSYIETSCGSQMMGNLHSGGANFSFIDGHVKWLTQAQQGELLCAIENIGSTDE